MLAIINNDRVVDTIDETKEKNIITRPCPDNCRVGWKFVNDEFIPSTEDKKIEALWDAVANNDTTALDALKLLLEE